MTTSDNKNSPDQHVSAWIIGASGLLGSAVAKVINARPAWNLAKESGLTWGDADLIREQTQSTFRALISNASAAGGSWAIFWLAGRVSVSASESLVSAELLEFDAFIDGIRRVLEESHQHVPGTIFFASSAGGVYGGTHHPPFDEFSEARAISPYGDLKLAMEQHLQELQRATSIHLVLGRISNIYGPGQSSTKPQGLISHLARAQLDPQKTVRIIVPLESSREYIFVTDCAAMVLDATERALETDAATTIKIISSGQATTIAELIGHFSRITRKRVNAATSRSEDTKLHPVDLRLNSTVWPDLDRRTFEPLPSGINATYLDVLKGLQRG